MKSRGWIDVTVSLRNGMVRWPDNPPVRVKRVLEMRRGDPCNLTPLSMGVHSGTHMDAPVHFIPKGLGIDAMPVDAGVGRARVIAIRDPALILGRKNCAGIESVPVSELFSRLNQGTRHGQSQDLTP